MDEESDGSKALLGIVVIFVILALFGIAAIAAYVSMKSNPTPEMEGGYSTDALLKYFQATEMTPEQAFKTFLTKT